MTSNQSDQPSLVWTMDWDSRRKLIVDKPNNKDKRRSFILAHTSHWAAVLGWQVHQPGMIVILARKKIDRKKCSFLGHKDIPYQDELMPLLNKVSKVIRAGLPYCEKVYLLSLCESEGMGLHFMLIPRYIQDRENAKDQQTGGITLISKWELTVRHGESCEFAGFRIPSLEKPQDAWPDHPWYEYAYKIWDYFNEGLKKVEPNDYKGSKKLDPPPLKFAPFSLFDSCDQKT